MLHETAKDLIDGRVRWNGACGSSPPSAGIALPDAAALRAQSGTRCRPTHRPPARPLRNSRTSCLPNPNDTSSFQPARPPSSDEDRGGVCVQIEAPPSTVPRRPPLGRASLVSFATCNAQQSVHDPKLSEGEGRALRSASSSPPPSGERRPTTSALCLASQGRRRGRLLETQASAADLERAERRHHGLAFQRPDQCRGGSSPLACSPGRS